MLSPIVVRQLEVGTSLRSKNTHSACLQGVYQQLTAVVFYRRARSLQSQTDDMHRDPKKAGLPLCFIDPKDAIRVIAESVGREGRRQLLGELVRAWADEVPERELCTQYTQAISQLDEHDLSMLAAWHASLEVGQPIASREFLVNVFPTLGDQRREALKIAAGFRGEEAFDAGVAEEQLLDTVLPSLSRDRSTELLQECLELYCWDRLGTPN